MMVKALKDSGYDERELSILITGDEQIHELNKKYLNRDKPTNVISFPMTTEPDGIDTGMLGDIVISVDTAKKEAAEMDITPHERIYQLLIHGFLHLAGYDHELSGKNEKIMQKEEKRLFALMMED